MSRLAVLSRQAADPTGAPQRRAWADRLRQVADTLGRPCRIAPGATPSMRELTAELGRVVQPTDRGEAWLALAAISGQLPIDRTVLAVCRQAEFSGAEPLMAEIVAATTADTLHRPVRIVTGAVVVDVHHTAHTDLATGIQRVARETARRWSAAHPLTMVAWIDHFHAMRELTAREDARMTGEPLPPGTDSSPEESAARTDAAIVVPWTCTYALPELVADRERNKRILAMARYAPNRTGAIGFDCIPITSGDTSDVGVPDFFADHLATVRHFDRITTISQAAGGEYGGWSTMLGAIGMVGPEITPILLPAEAPPVDDDVLARASGRFRVAGMPMVLCVGTHEPRKNHGAVLHAAEILWREGLEFSLTFIGGHSWRGQRFSTRLTELQAAGRPVESASGISDEMLWAAYRLARCTIFPSFNEGFGLPVAESIAAGTPAITSGYGSMHEIGADGGVLFVDPRDDTSVTDALRRLLTNEDEYHRLRADAASRPARTWDDYAADVWEYLVG
ncbi:glycosyltransferase [Cellulomonas sp.]|uniref:glycosyltransferase n=1 Tax=Cellulomonas sp. TaxID=40001 RepID=UPI003BAA0D65